MAQSSRSDPDVRSPVSGPAPARRARTPISVIFAFLVPGFVAGAILGAGLVYFGFERPALEAAQRRIEQNEVDLAAQRARLEEATTLAAALEGRLMVEESTRRGLETTLGTLQGELGRARDTLAFYEQLIPPGPDGAVSIRALDIERVGPHLQYRALLMRSGRNEKPFEGELQFIATGRMGEQEVNMPLEPAVISSPDPSSESAQAPQGTALAVSFSEFQRSSGLLGLPEGFEPESITVNVLEGRKVRVSRSIKLAPQP